MLKKVHLTESSKNEWSCWSWKLILNFGGVSNIRLGTVYVSYRNQNTPQCKWNKSSSSKHKEKCISVILRMCSEIKICNWKHMVFGTYIVQYRSESIKIHFSVTLQRFLLLKFVIPNMKHFPYILNRIDRNMFSATFQTCLHSKFSKSKHIFS